MNTYIQIREIVMMTLYWAASTNTWQEREIHEIVKSRWFKHNVC